MSNENVALKSALGKPAIEENEFFGREEELKRLIQKVTQGESVYINAPRRIGKTSLMGRAEKLLRNDGNICFFHDLEGNISPSNWISELFSKAYEYAGFIEYVKVMFKNFLNLSGKITKSELKNIIMNSEQWDSQGKNILGALYDSCPEGKRIVIFLDELAVMIETMQKKQPEGLSRNKAHDDVVRFLTWLRSIHQEFHKKISFVIASSIGLPPLLERLNLSAHINYFTNLQIDSWAPDTVKKCILALARGNNIVISDETAENMTLVIGGQSFPYYVQVFFDSVNDHLFNNERDAYSFDELNEIYFKYLIRGNSIRATLRHMVERLKKCLSEKEFDLSLQILSKIAQNNDSTSKSALMSAKDEADADSVRHVLNILKHDGYIEEDSSGYRFRIKLLRDWWNNEYGY